MTHDERLIVSAYTGCLMCDFDEYHAFIEKTMGRAVLTHELGSKKFYDELREKLLPKFLELCEASE